MSHSLHFHILCTNLRRTYRVQKLRLTADEVFKVQSTVQTMALAAKQHAQPNTVEIGASTTAQDSPPEAPAKRATSFLESDSTTSDDEQDEEQQSNEAVQKEACFIYFFPILIQ